MQKKSVWTRRELSTDWSALSSSSDSRGYPSVWSKYIKQTKLLTKCCFTLNERKKLIQQRQHNNSVRLCIASKRRPTCELIYLVRLGDGGVYSTTTMELTTHGYFTAAALLSFSKHTWAQQAVSVESGGGEKKERINGATLWCFDKTSEPWCVEHCTGLS